MGGGLIVATNALNMVSEKEKTKVSLVLPLVYPHDIIHIQFLLSFLTVAALVLFPGV